MNEYLYAEVDFWMWDGDGAYYANGEHYVEWGPNGYTYDQVTAQRPRPGGEVTQFCNWSGPYAGFCQTLTGAGNWTGAWVREQDGGNGFDGCYFEGSEYAPFDAITGGEWYVYSGNQWGNDWIGYHAEVAAYYRSQGRAPCSTSFGQVMQIYLSGWEDYVYNTLQAGIGEGTVSATRDGVYASRSW